MNKECYSLQPPKIEVFPIHGGTDIILRKNIKKTTKEPMEEGGDSTSFMSATRCRSDTRHSYKNRGEQQLRVLVDHRRRRYRGRCR